MIIAMFAGNDGNTFVYIIYSHIRESVYEISYTLQYAFSDTQRIRSVESERYVAVAN